MQILSVIDPSKDGKITKLIGTVVFKLRNFQFIICLLGGIGTVFFLRQWQNLSIMSSTQLNETIWPALP